VTFIDDYSTRTWIFFMKTKDEFFNRFREFRDLVENQTGKKIKVFRSDNEGEYTSNEFKYLYKEVGIKRDMTLPFNPRHNGIVERKNQTMVEVARAMLHDHDLPIMIWDEVCNTTVYVQNKIPHNILEEKTHEDEFIGVQLEIGNLRISGCPVYFHVPKEKRKKLEPTGNKGVFVGYNETSKAYQIYILGQRYVEIIWDVRFEEDLSFRRPRETTTGGEE
jgi:hypothetical protein